MVLSHAYLQTAKVSPELQEKDPDNRLLARGPRMRLPAESIRDQSLALAGLLSDKVGGPPVHPPIPEGVWRPFTGGDKWQTPDEGQADRYRRSLYTYVKRTIPYPAFATFDAPSREFCNPRRLTSNTPLQALMTLNDEAFVEAAEALAGRMETVFAGSVREKLSTGYRLVTSVQPTKAQLDQLEALYQEIDQPHSGDAPAPDNAPSGWVVVAQVLLNLDEVLTY